MRIRWMPLLNADGGAGGSGGSAPQQSAPVPAPASPAPAPTPQAGLQSMIDRHNGDNGRVAELLYRDNYDLREANRRLREQVPPQGAVVLTGEQATAWAAYQQLGTAAELSTRLSTAEQATTELATLRRSLILREAAELSGYKPSVLTMVAKEVTLRIDEQTKDGATIKTPVVVIAGEGGKETVTPLRDYATAHWADILPALQAQGEPQGTRFPSQPSSTAPNAQGSDPTKAALNKAYGHHLKQRGQ